MFDDDTAEG